MAKKKKRTRRGPSTGGAAGNGHGGIPSGAVKADRPSAREQGLLQLPTGQGATVFPPMRGSFGRGFYAAGANLIILLAPGILIFLIWMVLVAVGQRLFPPGIATLFAIPPISSGFDVQTSLIIFGFSQVGLLGIFALTLVRGLVWAILVGMLDEMMEFNVVTRVGILRGVRAFPAVLLYNYLCLGIALAASYILPTFFGQLGQMLSLAALIGGVFFLVFAPVSAIRQQVPGREAILRSIKGARLPGWPRHLLMAVLYFLVAVIVLQILNPEKLAITANPTFQTWAYVLGATFVQIGFLGAFIDRWKSIEGYVPQQIKPREAPAPRQRRR